MILTVVHGHGPRPGRAAEPPPGPGVTPGRGPAARARYRHGSTTQSASETELSHRATGELSHRVTVTRADSDLMPGLAAAMITEPPETPTVTECLDP